MMFLQGRVSTEEVFALSNSDLVPGKYEGRYCFNFQDCFFICIPMSMSIILYIFRVVLSAHSFLCAFGVIDVL